MRKSIIQCGIKEVIYDQDKYGDTPGVKASKRMMDAAGVKYTRYKKSNRKEEKNYENPEKCCRRADSHRQKTDR